MIAKGFQARLCYADGSGSMEEVAQVPSAPPVDLSCYPPPFRDAATSRLRRSCIHVRGSDEYALLIRWVGRGFATASDASRLPNICLIFEPGHHPSSAPEEERRSSVSFLRKVVGRGEKSVEQETSPAATQPQAQPYLNERCYARLTINGSTVQITEPTRVDSKQQTRNNGLVRLLKRTSSRSKQQVTATDEADKPPQPVSEGSEGIGKFYGALRVPLGPVLPAGDESGVVPSSTLTLHLWTGEESKIKPSMQSRVADVIFHFDLLQSELNQGENFSLHEALTSISHMQAGSTLSAAQLPPLPTHPVIHSLGPAPRRSSSSLRQNARIEARSAGANKLPHGNSLWLDEQETLVTPPLRPGITGALGPISERSDSYGSQSVTVDPFDEDGPTAVTMSQVRRGAADGEKSTDSPRSIRTFAAGPRRSPPGNAGVSSSEDVVFPARVEGHSFAPSATSSQSLRRSSTVSGASLGSAVAAHRDDSSGSSRPPLVRDVGQSKHTAEHSSGSSGSASLARQLSVPQSSQNSSLASSKTRAREATDYSKEARDGSVYTFPTAPSKKAATFYTRLVGSKTSRPSSPLVRLTLASDEEESVSREHATGAASPPASPRHSATVRSSSEARSSVTLRRSVRVESPRELAKQLEVDEAITAPADYFSVPTLEVRAELPNEPEPKERCSPGSPVLLSPTARHISAEDVGATIDAHCKAASALGMEPKEQASYENWRSKVASDADGEQVVPKTPPFKGRTMPLHETQSTRATLPSRPSTSPPHVRLSPAIVLDNNSASSKESSRRPHNFSALRPSSLHRENSAQTHEDPFAYDLLRSTRSFDDSPQLKRALNEPEIPDEMHAGAFTNGTGTDYRLTETDLWTQRMFVAKLKREASSLELRRRNLEALWRARQAETIEAERRDWQSKIAAKEAEIRELRQLLRLRSHESLSNLAVAENTIT